MPLIPEDKIAEIRDRTDIVQVIGEYVPLRRSGVNHKGLCPFHGEKSPSFNVNSAKQMFHCFGCGKSGDVIRFVMEHDSKPFMEVIKELAKRAGIDLPEPEVSPAERDARKRAESDRSRTLKLNRLAMEFFAAEYAAPSGERARAYVEEKRGISKATIASFAIGYAPAGWVSLTRFLESKLVPHELCESAGLLRARDGARLAPNAPPTQSSHYDLFRDRVMCPLLSPQSDIIAFSGRTLVKEEIAPDGSRTPKYINSPETIVYKKGENLYGLHVARQAIRKVDRAILVEGNFDVLMMHERGFAETVAPMGTALTASQVHLLARSAPKKVFMLLDGDAAGSSAAARNVGLFLDADQLSFVATLPRGDDPDTFVARDGREALEVVFSHARESVEYFCEYGWNRTGASVMERAKLLEEEAAPIIRKVQNPVARQRFAERLALTLALPLGDIHRVLRGARSASVGASSAITNQNGQQGAPIPAALSVGGDRAEALKPLVKPDKVDLQLLALLAEYPQLLQKAARVLTIVENEPLRRALGELLSRESTATLNFHDLSGMLPESVRSDVMAAAIAGRPGSSNDRWGGMGDVADPEKVLESLARRRRVEAIDRELVDVKKKLADASASSDASVISSLSSRIIGLNQARSGLKG